MGRSMHKFSHFSPPYSGEEKMLLQLDIAGKVVYLLILIVLLLLYFQKWKRNRVNVVHGDNGGETIRRRIARRVRAGGQYAEEVRFDVASDEELAVGASDEELAVGAIGASDEELARRVRAGGQYAGEARFDVAGDDDGGTINGEIAMGPTAIAATMPFEFN